MNLNQEPTRQSQEEKFDITRYVDERSPEKRLAMAGEFIQNADATWILAYSSTARQINTIGESRTQLVDQKLSEKESEEWHISPVVQGMQDLWQNVAFGRFMLDQGTLSQEQFDHLVDLVKQNMKNLFQITENSSAGVQEALDWLTDKLISGDVFILNSTTAKDDEERANIQKMSKDIASTFALGGMSKLDKSQKDMLVVVGDLISAKTSATELLLSIAHEHGHEILNQNGFPSPTSEDTQLVFEEFFPILEAQRVFSGLSEEEKQTISASATNSYEVGSDLDNADFFMNLPSLMEPIKMVPNVTSNSLLKAYAHSLESHLRYQRYKAAAEMLKSQMDVNVIKQKLAEMKVVTTPIIETPVWNRVTKTSSDIVN